jgi:hypothetical protein
VTRTSLAVDAVREGRKRPEEYSDDDGAITDAVCPRACPVQDSR